jgi:PST family polysaccharide transporter
MSPIASAGKTSPLFHNLVALFGVQAVNYIVPLLTIPYLTRVLKPEGWGEVAFVQSLGLMLITLIEYGFSLSAARDVSVRRGDNRFLRLQFGSVTGAKLVLLAIASSLSLIALRWVPFLRSNPRMFAAGLVWAAAQGMSPMWLYQGLERLRFSSLIDVCWKALGVAALFVFVKTASAGQMVLTIYATASVCSTLTLYTAALLKYGVTVPGKRDIARVLREGWPVFILQVAVSMYTTANAFVLGLFAPQYEVGVYSGAERVSKSLLGLLGPLNQALYPRMNTNVHTDKSSAARTVRRAFYWVLGLTAAIALLVAFVAAPLIHVFLGHNFGDSIAVLRIMVLLLPIVGASNMLGLQWMLPLRMDRQFSTIIVCGGVLNILLASILARHLFARGMATSAVCAELTVTLSCLLYLSKKRLNPLTPSKMTLPDTEQTAG